MNARNATKQGPITYDKAVYRNLIIHSAIPMLFAPAFVSVKQNSVPSAFETTHARDGARYAVKFAGLMALGRHGERICWVENEINRGVPCPRKSPTVPFDVFQFRVRRVFLSHKFSFKAVRPQEPSDGGAEYALVLKQCS